MRKMREGKDGSGLKGLESNRWFKGVILSLCMTFLNEFLRIFGLKGIDEMKIYFFSFEDLKKGDCRVSWRMHSPIATQFRRKTAQKR